MHIVYLPNAADFVANIEGPLDGRTRRMIRLLETYGNTLRMPFSKSIEDGVFELRVVGAVQIRLLYFFHKGEAVIVHALIKKTEQLNRRDIEYALQARDMYIANS